MESSTLCYGLLTCIHSASISVSYKILRNAPSCTGTTSNKVSPRFFLFTGKDHILLMWTIIRISLDAEGTAIFMPPQKDDFQNLGNILPIFGEVTRLATNFQKSMVVPIRRGEVNLDEVLSGLPVIRSFFPIKYLGLLLSVWQLKRVDFQPLEYKIEES